MWRYANVKIQKAFILRNLSNKHIGKIKSSVDTTVKGGKMVSGIVRQESWMNEVLWINSLVGRRTEVKFVYSTLGTTGMVQR